MEHVITIVCLSIVALFSAVAVFYADYDDSLFERVALSLLSIGSSGMAKYIYSVDDVPGAVLLCSIGGAVYALEVGRKVIHEKSNHSRAHPGSSSPAD